MKQLWRVFFIFTVVIFFQTNVVLAAGKSEKDIRCAISSAVLRARAKKDSPEIAKLKKYSPLKLTGKHDGSWLEVQDYSGRVGWVRSSEVSRKLQCVVVKVDRSGLRSGPGKEFPLDSTAMRGASFLDLGGEDGWTRVQDADGHVAWINLDHLWRPTMRLRLSFEHQD